MKKFIVMLCCGVIVTSSFFGNSIKAEAISNSFDPVYYAEKYPDVKLALGTDPDVLYKHYIDFGISEGRFQNAAEEATGIPNTDTTVYITPLYDTYVDVDVVFQTVTYFEDGVAVFQSPCVTGNTKYKHDTPQGEFKIECKVPGKYLVGPTWKCWVNRWMRFTSPKKAVGFHDASWRSNFGGDIYQSDGSHGCVNLPKDAAYQLYDLVSVGTKVVVH